MSYAAEVLPADFLTRLSQILDDSAYESAIESFGGPKAISFRVNPLKADVDGVRAELEADGFDLAPVAWKQDAFSVPSEQRRPLTDSPACLGGRLYIQNLSSMLPSILLDPQPSEEVLDLCAAPGSKTLQLAAQMQNQGRIAAVESVRGRFFRLRANLETYGAENVQTYLKDGTQLWRNCDEMFDRALVDAACSSEGRFNAQEPPSFAYWSLKKDPRDETEAEATVDLSCPVSETGRHPRLLYLHVCS